MSVSPLIRDPYRVIDPWFDIGYSVEKDMGRCPCCKLRCLLIRDDAGDARVWSEVFPPSVFPAYEIHEGCVIEVPRD